MQYKEVSMTTSRFGEAPEAQFYRSARVYVSNSVWWFDTREGVQFGPFICKIAASCALAVYVAQHVHENATTRMLSTQIAGSQDRIAHMIEEVVEVIRQHQDFGQLAATNWAKWRLEELRRKATATSETVGRIRVLEFTLRHPEQTFSFDQFLRFRAR
ncbi:MAG: hypothetical protein KDJ27_21215 [Gammaproteobacteria bacterium]|nr:hypothetical protein [Gammaproteobacteria bacterium]